MIYFKRIFICLIWAGALNFLFFNVTSAEVENETPVDCQGQKIEYSEAKKEVRITGDVVIRYEDVKITADKVIVYPESKDVYATGEVSLYKGEDVLKADRLYYNFGTKKGTLIHGDFHSGKVFGEGQKIEKISEKELEALKGYFTTCNFDIPHYRIEAQRIKIYLGDKVVAQHILFYIGDIPVLYFPYYSYSLKENKPRVVVIPGHNKEWGYFILTAWRYLFNERSKGWVHLDWREMLGFGYGVDYEYNTQNYGQGLLKTYYTQERKRGLKEHVPAEKEKYRFSLAHRWDMDEDTRVLLEFHRYRDRNFLKDYFYEEYVRDPLPARDSYISIIRNKKYYSTSLLCVKRFNHFRTVTERLPQIRFNVNNYRLGDSRFYYTSVYQFDNLNQKMADTGLDSDVMRFHTDNGLRYPTRLIGFLDWIEFSPYAGRIETFYSRGIDGDKRDFFRGQWYAGYSLSTKIFRIFDIEGKYIGVEVNKLRHLITPTISYTYRRRPTVLPRRLEAFDGIDAYNADKYYTFSLENKLQTKWYKEGSLKKEKIDLITLRSSVNFYPQIEGDSFSNVTSSLNLQPSRWLELGLTTNYNPYSRDFEDFNLQAKAEKSKWKVELSSRYSQKSQFHEGILKATYTLSPKWRLGIYERYDFQDKDLVEQEYAFERDLHCWTAELIWNTYRPGGETIWLVFKPKAFPDFPVEFVTSYHSPKVGSQSEWRENRK